MQGGRCPLLKAAGTEARPTEGTEARPTDARKTEQEFGKTNGVPKRELGNERKVARGQQQQPPKVLSG
jgi:hypothetical protein